MGQFSDGSCCCSDSIRLFYPNVAHIAPSSRPSQPSSFARMIGAPLSKTGAVQTLPENRRHLLEFEKTPPRFDRKSDYAYQIVDRNVTIQEVLSSSIYAYFGCDVTRGLALYRGVK